MSNEFQWTDNIVKSFLLNYNGLHSFEHNVEQFKQSKSKKEYEILSFTADWNNMKDALFTNERFLFENGAYHNNAKIKSVRRLSDGEVFMVGDKVKYNGEKCNYHHFSIDNFFIRGDGKMLARDSENCICEFISEIDKVKQPLFTTEDGVSIYKGDRYYWPCDKIVHEEIAETYSTIPNAKLFSTRELADNYILMNKPVLCLQDIHNHFKKYVGYGDGVAINKLTELAQEKINTK